MELSLLRPVTSGRVSQWFGGNPAMYARFGLPGHNGIDYAVPVGTTVVAAHDGVIEVPPFDSHGYGNYVIMRAENGSYYTIYAHLRSRCDIPSGMFGFAGNLIGYSGNTGNSSGPHLHFGLRILKQNYQSQPFRGWVDPWAFRD